MDARAGGTLGRLGWFALLIGVLLPAACRKSSSNAPSRPDALAPQASGGPGITAPTAPVPPGPGGAAPATGTSTPAATTGSGTAAPSTPTGSGTTGTTPPGSTEPANPPLPAVGGGCAPITTAPGVLNPCGHAWAVAYSPDGHILATSGSWHDANVHLWRMPDGAPVRELAAHDGRCHDLAFSADGKLLASAGEADAASGTGMVKLWDVATGALVRSLPVTVPAGMTVPYATGVSFTHDGTRLVTAGAGPVELWTVADGTRLRSLPTTGTIYQARFSPDDARLLVAGSTGKAQVWDVSSGQLVLDNLATAQDQASAELSPDGKLIASNGPGGTVALWDAATGSALDSVAGHAVMMGRVAWVDGTRLVSNDWNGKVVLWQVGAEHKLAPVRTWATGSPLRDVADGINLAVSPDHRQVVVGSLVDGQGGFVFLAL